MSSPRWSLETQAVALGRPSHEAGQPVNEPITLTSTYRAGADLSYARVGNPTWSAFEEAIGGLEGGHALAFASGMASISAVLSLVPHAGVVVAPHHAYSGTTALLADLSASGAITVRHVDISDSDEVLAAMALEPAADLLIAESPTNPMLEVADLAAVVAAGHDIGALVMVDNTFATPLLQRPLEDGADIVIHSATKYLSGHSDVVLGVAVTADTEAGRELGERLHAHRTSRGAIPGPMEAWLALRGLRTLAVRTERSGATAALLAQRLAEHPAVSRVRYPGWGSIVAMEVAATDGGSGADSAEAVCAQTQLWTHSTSLGGVESQIERRRRHVAEVETVPDNLVRLSVGIESVDDLWRDLSSALDAI
ncbi:MAG: PLP-dependent aspartate aminotransferase family protein [Ornithinimicrobium sp.]